MEYDVIIIGAGAAGLMCAMTAAKRGRRVLVIDHAAKIGEKIRISGGGRCNFTNRDTKPDNYLSENPRFCISALKRYTPNDFITLIEAHHIAYHERDLGQLFCDGPATQIVDLFLDECRKADVALQSDTEIKHVEKSDSGYSIATSSGLFHANALVIASGGKSIPKIGATGFAYKLAEQFGLAVVEPRAGLVPLTFSPDFLARMKGLSGISLPATVRCGKTQFSGALLFTHRGLSGPCVLQISSYWREGQTVTIDLCPGTDVTAALKQAKAASPRQALRTALSTLLPKALAHIIADDVGSSAPLGETSDKVLARAAEHVNRWQVLPAGTEGYRTAEVTLGGIDTKALSSQTFEARDVAGLYAIGEAVDVTGQLGGYNFQWAWASGHACGEAV